MQQSDGYAGFLGNLRLPFVLLFLRLVGGVGGFEFLDAFGGLFGFGQLGLLELLQFVGGGFVVLGAFLPFAGMGDGLLVFGLVVDSGGFAPLSVDAGCWLPLASSVMVPPMVGARFGHKKTTRAGGQGKSQFECDGRGTP